MAKDFVNISESHGSGEDHVRRALGKKKNSITQNQEDKLILYERINEMVYKYGRNEVCYRAIRDELGISLQKSRRYVKESMDFFSFEGKEEKKFWKRFHIDIISGLIAKHKDSDDPKVLRAMEGLLKELRHATKFDVAELELPDFSELGQTPIMITSNPEEADLDVIKDSNKFIEEFLRNFDAEDAEIEDGGE